MVVPQKRSASRKRRPTIGDVAWSVVHAGHRQRAPASGNDKRKTEVLNIRVTPEEKQMILVVTDHLGLSVTQFITGLVFPLSRKIIEEQIFVASNEEFDSLIENEFLDSEVSERWNCAPEIT